MARTLHAPTSVDQMTGLPARAASAENSAPGMPAQRQTDEVMWALTAPRMLHCARASLRRMQIPMYAHAHL